MINKAQSPNGKATDSDSVISRFESWLRWIGKLIISFLFLCLKAGVYAGFKASKKQKFLISTDWFWQ